MLGKVRFRTYDLGGHEQGARTSALHSSSCRVVLWYHKTAPSRMPHLDDSEVGYCEWRKSLWWSAARTLWKDYFVAVNCIVFVVDANDRPRFQEAKEELNVRPTYRASPFEREKRGQFRLCIASMQGLRIYVFAHMSIAAVAIDGGAPTSADRGVGEQS